MFGYKKGLIEILIRLSNTTLLQRLGEVGFEMNKTSVLPPGALLRLSESLVWYVASMNVLYQTQLKKKIQLIVKVVK